MGEAISARELADRELDDFLRGAAGAFLFGVPLLYTMELWFAGVALEPSHALLLVAASLVLALVFVVVIGFREDQRPSRVALVAEAVDAVGIAAVVTAVTLLVLGRIGPGDDLDVIAGRIAIELLPVTLGVSVANHLLPRGGSRKDDDEDRESGLGLHPTVGDLFAAAAGALLLSLNIAPTDEVELIASELSEPRLVVVVLFSLLVSYVVVFEAEVGDEERRKSSEGILQSPLTETLAAYLIALLVAAGAAWLIGAFPDDAAPGTALAMMVVLGFPAAIGAAAGRLAV